MQTFPHLYTLYIGIGGKSIMREGLESTTPQTGYQADVHGKRRGA